MSEEISNGIKNLHELAQKAHRPFRDGGPASEKTLRDEFASQALPAVISAYVEANGRCIGTEHVLSNCSDIAFKFADAMLRASKA